MTNPSPLEAALRDRYRLERELGAGGMATVYLAEDLKHHRQVAVKVLRPELAATLGPERFLREVTIAAQLQHPHIVPLYDSGQAGGFLYYVMPYVEGESLRQKLVREGELPIGDAIRILRDVADGLAYAHRRGMVHRDIKPENVMLADRHALVTDFGVAKAVSEATGRQQLTTVGIALGTPAYMAPEQAAADPHTDHRADLYAFGALAYELLTGRPPFTGATPQVVLAAQVTQAADPVTKHRSSIPPVLAALVMKCLEKKPADRPQSAEGLVQQLEAVLTRSGGTTPAGVLPTAPLSTSSRRLVTASAIVALGVLGWQVARRSRAGPAGPEARSIAVLPLVIAAANADDEYLADGITDGLTSALGKVPGLKVASRNSAFLLKGKSLSVKQKADTLGVETILEGSMQRGLGRIRVTLQLLNAADGLARWTESYDRPATDLVAVQDEIVLQVATALRLQFRGLALAVSKAGRSTNAEATDLYLRGRFWMNKSSEDGLRKAIDYFQQAVAKDSSFAAAEAALAQTWSWIGDAYEPGWVTAPKAKAAASAALAHDSLLAEAHASMGQALWTSDWNATSAERHLRRAVELDANSSDAYLDLATFLCTGAVSRFAEGLEAARRAMVLNPLAPGPSWMREFCFFMSRQFDSVLVQARRTRELDPTFFYTESQAGLALLRLGRYGDALAEEDRVRQEFGDVAQYVPVMALAKMGRLADANKALRALENRGKTGSFLIPFMMAELYASVGEPERAVQILGQLFAHRDDMLFFHLEGPYADALRNDPGYDDLVRRVRTVAGLPPRAPTK